MSERNSALNHVRAAVAWLLPLTLAWLLLAAAIALSKQAWHWKAVPVPAQWPVEQALSEADNGCRPAPPANAGGLLARRVQIDLRPGREGLLLELDLADCSPRLARLRQTLVEQGGDADPERLLVAMFGRLHTGLSLRLGPPQLLKEADAPPRLRLQAQAEALSGGLPRALLVEPAPDGDVDTEVKVYTRPGDALWSSELAPLQQRDGEASWRLPAGQGGLLLQLLPAPASAASAPAVEPELPAAPAPALLRSLRGELDLLAALWLGLNLALPFLLIGEWARRGLAEAQPVGLGAQQALAQGCRLAMLWIALLALSDSLQQLLHALPPLSSWSPLLRQAWAGLLPDGHSIALAAAMVQVAILVGLLPSLLRGGVRPPRRGVASLLLLAALLLAVALLLPGLLSAQEVDDQPSEQALWAALPALLPAALFAALALALQLGLSVWHALLPLLLGSSLLLLLGDLNGDPMPLLAALFAIPLGLAYAPASRRWCPLPPPAAGQRRAWALGMVLLAALLALPEDLSQPWFYPWLLGSAAWSLLRLWQLPLLLLLLYWLAHCPPPRPGERLAPATRAAGGLLISFTMFWNANMPPLTVLLVGLTVYVLLRSWLFAPRVLRKPSRRRQDMLHDAINTLAAGQALRRARRDSRKGLQEQLGKGGLSLADWQGRQTEFGAAQAQLAPALRRARVVAMLALNLGGTSDPWRRGLQGALLSTLLALPWLLSYFNSLIASPPPPTHAYALTLLVEVLLDVAQWPALGFFFLYFYPHLRGHNGMQKGLVLSLTAVLVALPSALVNSASQGAAAWPVYVFWTLQVFICCMCLGVALGDLAALRRAGRDLGSLFEVYNLGVLAAWGSSLALAVGAGLTTVLASQASTLAAKGLEALLKPAAGG